LSSDRQVLDQQAGVNDLVIHALLAVLPDRAVIQGGNRNLTRQARRNHKTQRIQEHLSQQSSHQSELQTRKPAIFAPTQ
jgi:hypothetical protein